MKIFKNLFLLSICSTLFISSCNKPEKGLKDAFQGKFMIGTALTGNQISGKDPEVMQLVYKEFNALTSENALKWDTIHPEPGVYNFEQADKFVDLCEKNNIFCVGHTLVWHAQIPDWVFQDSIGSLVGREELLQRMKDHIFTVMGRYKGRIQGWDVVNEALGDDSLKNTLWYQIIGEDYIEKAFEYAHEADPDARLYYNDYNIERPGKREATLKLLKKLLGKGVKIDGVGIQGHWHLDEPTLGCIDSSILAYSELGLDVMVTELDVNVLPRPKNMDGAEVGMNFKQSEAMNPYKNELPDSMDQALAKRYADFFKIFVKHSDKISRITFWGITDDQSWLNDWPIYGRTNYPLLFDRNYMPKKAYFAVKETAQN